MCFGLNSKGPNLEDLSRLSRFISMEYLAEDSLDDLSFCRKAVKY